MAEMAVQPAASEAERLSRKSIPLAREIGFWAVVVFAFSSMGLGDGGLLPFSTFAGMWPGANLAGVIAVGVVVLLIYAYVFAVIGAVAPHYGADYVVASRVISPPLAFASSLALVLFLSLTGGVIISHTAQNIIPMFTQILTLITGDRSLSSALSWVLTPSGIVTLGTIGVVIVYLLLILPPRVSRWFILLGAALVVFAWGLICVWLASAKVGTFPVAWNTYMGNGSYQDQFDQARGLRMGIILDKRAFAFAGWMLALWILAGFNNPTYFAKEIKQPGKNLLLGSWLALVVVLILLGGTAFLLQRQVPTEWLSAVSFLSASGLFQGQAMPWLPLYAAVLRPNVFWIYVLGACWVFSLLNVALNFLYTASRIILAWGEDNVVSRSLAYVHPELRSPLVAVLIVCFIAEMSVLEAGLSIGVVRQLNPVYIIVATQLLPVLAVALLPFRKPEWFNSAPGLVRFKLGPLPLITLVGILAFLSLVGTIVAFVLIPGFYPLNADTVTIFVVPVLAALAWFYWRRYSLRKDSGELLDLVYKNPPEE